MWNNKTLHFSCHTHLPHYQRTITSNIIMTYDLCTLGNFLTIQGGNLCTCSSEGVLIIIFFHKAFLYYNIIYTKSYNFVFNGPKIDMCRKKFKRHFNNLILEYLYLSFHLHFISYQQHYSDLSNPKYP